ncbi:MAG: pyridoxine/pyridoxal/pyridoxamine kinase [Oscillospiraceae bacterium]|nr:pyridoxine/pyridoxal/pyridoxamine kinase [Oscillospiraceae bacterium]
MKKALSIAGSDTSGGAGIQADLKTFQELGVYGMTALTVIVSMDPHNSWAHQVFPVDIDILKAQIETAVVGIGVDAMKTGMLPTTDIIELAAFTVKKNNLQNVVVDPVMVCKGAGEAIHPENAECYAKTLVPLARVVTPNLFEASQLTGIKDINSLDKMKDAAQIIYDLGAKCVIIKGGKGSDDENAIDIVYDGKSFEQLSSPKIQTSNTHGAGCTFSAAIAAELAKGSDLHTALSVAKAFISAAIKHSFRLNQYVGPTCHSAYKANV